LHIRLSPYVLNYSRVALLRKLFTFQVKLLLAYRLVCSLLLGLSFFNFRNDLILDDSVQLYLMVDGYDFSEAKEIDAAVG
jgi:hypothetical protein